MSDGVLAWLSVWSKVHTCIWHSWCHCHSLSLASVKSRLVLPFWYRLTRVVPGKGPLNGCVCVCKSKSRCAKTKPTKTVWKIGLVVASKSWPKWPFQSREPGLHILHSSVAQSETTPTMAHQSIQLFLMQGSLSWPADTHTRDVNETRESRSFF